MATPLAYSRWNIRRCVCLRRSADGLSVLRLRLGSSSQLCVLPARSISLDEARVHGPDLSADRSHAEAVVRLPARTFCGFPRLGCGPFRFENAMEKSSNSQRCCCVVGCCRLLLSLQCFVLGVGWRMVVRSTLLGAGLPLLCAGLAPAWSSANPHWRRVLAALAICGALFSLMAVSTTAQPPDQFRCPLFQLLAPSFLAGKLSLTQGSMLTSSEAGTQGHGAFNLGELAGLHGLPSLIPLFVVWGVATFLWSRMNHAEQRAAENC